MFWMPLCFTTRHGQHRLILCTSCKKSNNNITPLAKQWAGIAQPVQRLTVGWMVLESSPGEGKIFRTRPDRLWGPSSLLYDGYRVSFPRIKRPGRGVNHPPTSSADVKEKVELYLYSLSGLSRPVLGLTLSKLLPTNLFRGSWNNSPGTTRKWEAHFKLRPSLFQGETPLNIKMTGRIQCYRTSRYLCRIQTSRTTALSKQLAPKPLQIRVCIRAFTRACTYVCIMCVCLYEYIRVRI